jgi:hypothetical protein
MGIPGRMGILKDAAPVFFGRQIAGIFSSNNLLKLKGEPVKAKIGVAAPSGRDFV